ncbi:hypothetical protein BpHYR1_009254 [Brachionus plicatilis]|uniref:Uncharacterized protein n=1 Tax=Brachionus plicatilis TaxID=10195 RepID=A0A3M7P643_BRAPC|nr:hypothetical protein BpHYR1_009254 [Brachionus plicatilis]
MHFVPRSTTSVCKAGCFPNILTFCFSSSYISVGPLGTLGPLGTDSDNRRLKRSAPFTLLISTNNLKRFHHVRISCLGVRIVGLNDHSLDGVDSFRALLNKLKRETGEKNKKQGPRRPGSAGGGVTINRKIQNHMNFNLNQNFDNFVTPTNGYYIFKKEIPRF